MNQTGLSLVTSLPLPPSPSLYPLIQLGESCEILDSQKLASDKLRRIRELEDNVRVQEDLKGKLINGHKDVEYRRRSSPGNLQIDLSFTFNSLY